MDNIFRSLPVSRTKKFKPIELNASHLFGRDVSQSLNLHLLCKKNAYGKVQTRGASSFNLSSTLKKDSVFILPLIRVLTEQGDIYVVLKLGEMRWTIAINLVVEGQIKVIPQYIKDLTMLCVTLHQLVLPQKFKSQILIRGSKTK